MKWCHINGWSEHRKSNAEAIHDAVHRKTYQQNIYEFTYMHTQMPSVYSAINLLGHLLCTPPPDSHGNDEPDDSRDRENNAHDGADDDTCDSTANTR